MNNQNQNPTSDPTTTAPLPVATVGMLAQCVLPGDTSLNWEGPIIEITDKHAIVEVRPDIEKPAATEVVAVPFADLVLIGARADRSDVESIVNVYTDKSVDLHSIPIRVGDIVAIDEKVGHNSGGPVVGVFDRIVIWRDTDGRFDVQDCDQVYVVSKRKGESVAAGGWNRPPTSREPSTMEDGFVHVWVPGECCAPDERATQEEILSDRHQLLDLMADLDRVCTRAFFLTTHRDGLWTVDCGIATRIAAMALALPKAVEEMRAAIETAIAVDGAFNDEKAADAEYDRISLTAEGEVALDAATAKDAKGSHVHVLLSPEDHEQLLAMHAEQAPNLSIADFLGTLVDAIATHSAKHRGVPPTKSAAAPKAPRRPLVPSKGSPAPKAAKSRGAGRASVGAKRGRGRAELTAA